MCRFNVTRCCIPLLVVVLAAPSFGAPVPGDTATASTELGAPTFSNYTAIHAVDGSGLTGTMHSNSPDFNMWIAGTTAFGTVPVGEQWILFDLQARYNLANAQVWNQNELTGGTTDNTGRGINALNIWYSNALTAPSIGIDGTPGAGWTLFANTNLSQANALNSYTGESVNLGGITAKYVLFDVVSNHNLATTDYVGLSEISFDGTRAQQAVAGVTANASTTLFSDLGSTYGSQNTVNGLGLTFPEHSNVPETMWIAGGPSTGPLAVPIGEQWISFDLQESYILDYMHVWNQNELTSGTTDQTDRGIDEVNIYYSNDDIAPSIAGDGTPGAGWTLFTNTNFDQADTTNNYVGQPIGLGNITARHILFDIVSNHGDPDLVGLSEVQFFGTAIPEASSIVSGLIVGIVGLSFGIASLRRRRREGKATRVG